MGLSQLLQLPFLFVIPQLSLLHLYFKEEFVLLSRAFLFELLIIKIVDIVKMGLSEIIPVLLLYALLLEEFFLVTVEGMLHGTLDVDVL